jgi:hypothetical protein
MLREPGPDLRPWTQNLTPNTSDLTQPTPHSAQRYNIRVPSPEIRAPSAEPQTDSHKHHRDAVYASEATGLLLVLTLVRYWHHIHWSLR